MFYQEFTKIKRASKIFMMWENLKYIILIHVLNTTVKQTMMMKIQNAASNYIKIMKIKLNSTIKVVFKWIKHEIMILWYKCSFFDEEEIKSAKIMKIMNTKIENNSKRKIIIVRKLFNENIMLMLNLTETKNHMMKKID